LLKANENKEIIQVKPKSLPETDEFFTFLNNSESDTHFPVVNDFNTANDDSAVQSRYSSDKFDYSGEFKLRFQHLGTMKLFLVNTTSKTRVSNAVEVEVIPDPLTNLVPSYTKTYDNSKRESSSPKPSFRIKGVIPMTKRDPIYVPHTTVPALVSEVECITPLQHPY
jgi:hypothetical protein